VAGLSIGAYAAAVVANTLAFGDAVRLVALRGKLMEQAYPSGYGMTAILGLEQGPVEAIVGTVNGPDTPVYLANCNAETQFVVAGSDAAMARVAELAIDAGARSAQRVAIAVPSHCPLLDAAAASLAQAFAGVSITRPSMRYFSASAARELRDPSRIADDLAHNMAKPVRWHETMLLARACDMRLAIELPPGDVLTRLAKPVFPNAVALSNIHPDSARVLIERER
jgi:malonate decarboxylase epsilon subunit